jgi:nitrite reductase/ring-hydroxylating ferredoxin subunit
MLESDPAAAPVPLCASGALIERGDAVVFEVQQWRRKVRAFVMRFEGRVVAYLNRCAHVPAEMDWQEGKFLDRDRELIICSIHGATYDPLSGRCVGGPCAGGRLTALRVEEKEAQVYWYPSSDIKPIPVPSNRDAAAAGAGNESPP